MFNDMSASPLAGRRQFCLALLSAFLLALFFCLPASAASTSGLTVPEQVLYEGNSVTITANGIEHFGGQYNVKINICNNSEQNLSFNASAYGVNGLMIHNNVYSMYCTVGAGKTADVSLAVSEAFLEENDISQLKWIDTMFTVRDSSYTTEFGTGQIRIKTNLYDGEPDTLSGTELYNQNGLRVDHLYSSGNDYVFGLTNETGSPFTFDFRDIRVNGSPVTRTDFDLYDQLLLDGNQMLCTIKVDSGFMAERGIAAVQNLEWFLDVRDMRYNTRSIGPLSFNV